MSYFYPERDIAGGALTSEETKSKLADKFKDKLLLTLDQAEALKYQLEKDTSLLATVSASNGARPTALSPSACGLESALKSFCASFLADHAIFSPQCNAVDYSLFLVRIPITEAPNPFDDPQLNATPLLPPDPPSFRTGMPSTDGRWVYRAAVLDFFCTYFLLARQRCVSKLLHRENGPELTCDSSLSGAKHKAHAKAMSLLINAYNIFDRKGPMSVTTNSPEYRQRFLNMIYDMIEVRDDTTEQNG